MGSRHGKEGAAMSFFSDKKEQWDILPNQSKWLLGTVVILGISAIIYLRMQQPAAGQKAGGIGAPSATTGVVDGQPKDVKLNVLPESNRNQGLDDMERKIDALTATVTALVNGQPATNKAQNLPANTPKPINLDKPLPPRGDASPSPVFFPEEKDSKPIVQKRNQPPVQTKTTNTPEQPPIQQEDDLMVIPASVIKKTSKIDPRMVIPAHSALEAIMLSGVNARPTGGITAQVGSALSANSVGAPFVTRIKNEAILPNGWRAADFADCFMGGNAVASISAERALAISNTISCIANNGDLFEAPIKAYALDVDGILGISGKVVSKQGTLVMQAALSGMIGGLAQATSPQAIPSYSTSAVNGQTQPAQSANLGLVAQTAVGNGAAQAGAQLAKFYLDYAKEVFPVIEVSANTRVTWVLQETVEFKRIKRITR